MVSAGGDADLVVDNLATVHALRREALTTAPTNTPRRRFLGLLSGSLSGSTGVWGECSWQSSHTGRSEWEGSNMALNKRLAAAAFGVLAMGGIGAGVANAATTNTAPPPSTQHRTPRPRETPSMHPARRTP